MTKAPPFEDVWLRHKVPWTQTPVRKGAYFQNAHRPPPGAGAGAAGTTSGSSRARASPRDPELRAPRFDVNCKSAD